MGNTFGPNGRGSATSGVQDFGDGGLDALVGVGDHQLDAAQAAAGELAQEGGPEGLGLGRISMPRISRRPSPLTPTATITATETMRPCWRTFTEVASTHREDQSPSIGRPRNRSGRY
jgi:hypothetical protein